MTGFSDEAKCFYCEGIIHAWEPHDEPWDEHKKWYPNCGFLKQPRPEGNPVSSSFRNGQHMPQPTDINNADATMAVSGNDNKSNDDPKGFIANERRFGLATGDTIVTALLEEIQKLREEKLCKICMDKERELTFRPCGHFVCCSGCTHSLQHCPLCRTKIVDID